MRTVIAAVLLLCSATFPWGVIGHRVVAAIAWNELDSASRAAIARFLPPGSSLKDISTWADEIRHHRPQTRTWHYINPHVRKKVGKRQLDEYRDRNRGDLLTKLEQFVGELERGDGDKERFAEALFFVVHLMGDIHMPLHCVGDDDRGGNDKMVRFYSPDKKGKGRKINLHALWDQLIQVEASENPDSLALVLQKRYENKKSAIRKTISPEDMLLESYNVARKEIYKHIPPGAFIEPYDLPENYFFVKRPVAELQLYKAGQRLAAFLETITRRNSDGFFNRR